MKEKLRNIYLALKKIPYLGGFLVFLRRVYKNSFLERRRLFMADKRRAHEVLTLFFGADSQAHGYLEEFIQSPFFTSEFSYGHSGDFDVMMLYSATRMIQPKVVVETGVASGRSSTAILRALSENNEGMLYSVDLPQFYEANSPGMFTNKEGNEELRGFVPSGKEPGWLVPKELRSRWKLILGDSNKELPLLLEKLDVVDIFYHDGDHTLATMAYEFSTLWTRIPAGGFLFSDDVKWNSAWGDFLKDKPGFLTALYRNFGILRK